LANAAEFAGKSIGYSDLRPPFISYLISIVFRFDGLSVAPIFIIDGIFYILGTIGLFLLLKLRFNSLYSFLGSLLYATFPILLTYVAVGFPELSSISISIWALYFAVLAVKRDSKFFFISFPLAMLAFLTKFNQALIIFPLFLYILINWKNIKNQRNIAFGIAISSLIIIPVLIYYSFKYGNPLFPFLDFYGTSSNLISEHFDYNPDPFFYIKLLPLVIGNGALLVILTIVGGLLFSYIKLFLGKSSIPEFKINFKENLLIKLSLSILFVVFLISWGSVSYLLSEILFFFILLGLFKLLKHDNKYDLDFLFLSWFASFLIFISAYSLKDIRYFLMILPPFAYFLIRGLKIVENQVGLIKQRKLTSYFAPIFILVIILSTAFYIPTITDANNNLKTDNINMEEASHWLVNYDPDYKSKIVFSDLWPNTAWFLQMNVRKMPEFKNNQKYYLNLKDYKPTEEDSDSANNFLVENNADYYFSIRDWVNLNNYDPINKFGYLTIYKRNH
jgi:4-amino-4-deoxy-L-arabinose transferase-like glycosyltransferase